MVTWDVGTLPQVVVGRRVRHRRDRLPGAARRRHERVAARPDERRPAAARDARRRPAAAAADRGAVGARRAEGPDRAGRLAIAASGFDLDALVADCTFAAVDQVLRQHELPWDADAFAELQRVRAPRGAGRSPPGRWRGPADVLVEVGGGPRPAAPADRAGAAALRRRRRRPTSPGSCGRGSSSSPARPGSTTSPATSAAIAFRLDRLAEDVGRDRRRMDEVVPLEDEYAALLRRGRDRPRRSSSSAGASRSCASACSPSRSAPRAAVSATKVRRELAHCADDPSECLMHPSASLRGPTARSKHSMRQVLGWRDRGAARDIGRREPPTRRRCRRTGPSRCARSPASATP